MFGVGAELLASLHERGFSGRAQRIGALPVPIPAARTMESVVLPVKDTVIRRIVRHLDTSDARG